MASGTFKINDIDYVCEFTLTNPDNQKVSFTKSAIQGMVLVDNIFDPFMTGNISISNPYEFMEDGYFFRGDGRDELLIQFYPKQTDPNHKIKKFKRVFVITDDFDNMDPETRAKNVKTFNLIAKDSVSFTDKIPYGKVYSGKVGKIIKDIFIEVLGEESVDNKRWEEGDFETVYYTPATFRYIDVLRYFLRIFYAKDGDLYVKGFVNYDDSNNKYCLELLSKIYSDNSNRVLETFGVGDLVDRVGFDNPNNPIKSNAPTGKYINQLRNVRCSTPMYDWTTGYCINSLVVGYDPMMGQQKIANLKFEDVRNRWKKKFVDSFSAMGGKPKLFAIKNMSTDKRFKRYKFPYPVEIGKKILESEIHNQLTFFNLQLSFINIGSVSRVAGKFIDIFSPKKTTSSIPKSQEKLLGRWFITEIRHIFLSELYTNQIFATKTYVGPQSSIKENVK